MLASLKFTKGAIAKKDFIPALTHFRISGGRVKSFNGKLALCSDIALDIEATPKALPFIKAIEACDDQVTMYLTGANRLAIRSGSFRAFIDCTTEVFPELEPAGTWYPLEDCNLVAILKKIKPFIAEDASRPWARGVLFNGDYCYATNNVSLISHALPRPFPVTVNIPEDAITELVRVNKEPIGLQVDDTSITFFYSEHQWIRSNLYETKWPDVTSLLTFSIEDQFPPQGLEKALEGLAPFTDDLDRVYFSVGEIATIPEKDNGARIDLIDSTFTGVFNRKQLLLAVPLASSLVLVNEPRPAALFSGPELKGVIIGMRDL